MLSEAESTSGSAWVWVGMHDYHLFEVYQKAGVTVVQEPMNHEWA